MLFWIWKIYAHILIALCQLGITLVALEPPSPDGWGGCWPFDVEPWTSRVFLRHFLNQNYEGFRDLALTDPDFTLRLEYPWGNVTLLVPDPESQEWKNLEYEKEISEWPCIENVHQKCPHILRFLKHHYIEHLIPMDKKVKTLAGNKIWWSKEGDDKYIYPGKIKILQERVAWNGELWLIQKPLWSERSR
jgi:hypothetical protein